MITDAIDADRPAGAKALARNLIHEWKGLHDLYCDRIPGYADQDRAEVRGGRGVSRWHFYESLERIPPEYWIRPGKRKPARLVGG